MIYLNVVLTVNATVDIDTVRGLLIRQCTASRLEPGCARFEVYHSTTDPTQFVLVEHWQDQQAVDAHRQATAFKQIYEPLVLPLVTRAAHPSLLLC